MTIGINIKKQQQKKQRNFCVKLLHKTKQDYFNNIDIKSVSDTIKFWETIKPYLSNND